MMSNIYFAGVVAGIVFIHISIDNACVKGYASILSSNLALMFNFEL